MGGWSPRQFGVGAGPPVYIRVGPWPLSQPVTCEHRSCHAMKNSNESERTSVGNSSKRHRGAAAESPVDEEEDEDDSAAEEVDDATAHACTLKI